jgi:hypothetical protein
MRPCVRETACVAVQCLPVLLLAAKGLHGGVSQFRCSPSIREATDTRPSLAPSTNARTAARSKHRPQMSEVMQ